VHSIELSRGNRDKERINTEISEGAKIDLDNLLWKLFCFSFRCESQDRKNEKSSKYKK
jgi:hypothetical protein